jgi:hypothetical protein
MKYKKEITQIIKILAFVVLAGVLAISIFFVIWWASFYFTHIFPDRYEFTVEVAADENTTYSFTLPCPVYEQNRTPLFFVYQLQHTGCGYVYPDNVSNESCLRVFGKGHIKSTYAARERIPEFTMSMTNWTFQKDIMSDRKRCEIVLVVETNNMTKNCIYLEMKLEYWLNNEIRHIDCMSPLHYGINNTDIDVVRTFVD